MQIYSKDLVQKCFETGLNIQYTKYNIEFAEHFNELVSSLDFDIINTKLIDSISKILDNPKVKDFLSGLIENFDISKLTANNEELNNLIQSLKK
jgi:hypothetical protein